MIILRLGGVISSMEVFLSYLQDYNGALTMLAVIFVALTTSFSYRSIQKNLRNLREIPKPYVVLYLTKLNHDESVNYIVLENFGKAGASKIQIMTYPKLEVEFPKDNPFSLFIDYPISFLAPSQKIMSALPSGDYVSRRYDCTITYQDDAGQNYIRKQIMDFTYIKALLFSASPENKIAKNTEKITQTLEDISSKISR